MAYKNFLKSGISSRGLRNNNPCNLRIANGYSWEGSIPVTQNTDGAFVQFKELRYGFRAAIMLIENYFERYNLRTLRGIINRFAPPNENMTGLYVSNVANWTGFDADKVLTPDKKTLTRLVYFMAKHENNSGDFKYISMKDVEDGWELLHPSSSGKGLLVFGAIGMLFGTAAFFLKSR